MTGKAKLHWFWTAAIALSVGLVFYMTIWFNLWWGIWGSQAAWRLIPPDSFWFYPLRVHSHDFPVQVVALVVYGLLTRCLGPPAPDGELHCRRCNQILRGLSEPRCPECGRPFTFNEVRATPEELGFARSMG